MAGQSFYLTQCIALEVQCDKQHDTGYVQCTVVVGDPLWQTTSDCSNVTAETRDGSAL